MDDSSSGIKQLEIDIGEIKIEMNKMSEKLDKILIKIDEDVSTECKKMGEHIDFVENIYSTVRRPLGFICNRLNRIIRNNHIEYNLIRDVSNNQTMTLDD